MRQINNKERKALKQQQRQMEEQWSYLSSPSYMESGGGFFSFFFKVVAFLIGAMLFAVLFMFGFIASVP